MVSIYLEEIPTHTLSAHLSEVGRVRSSSPLLDVPQCNTCWTLFLSLVGVTHQEQRGHIHWVDPGWPLSLGVRWSNEDSLSLPSQRWTNQLTIALFKDKLFWNISYKILSFPLARTFLHISSSWGIQNSRIESGNCLLISAYDDLKPHVGNSQGLYFGAWLKCVFNILQYVIYSQGYDIWVLENQLQQNSCLLDVYKRLR